MPLSSQKKHLPSPSSPPRLIALDITRGVAVLGMVSVHYIPVTGDGTLFGMLCAQLSHFSAGKTAALFCLLAGITWSYSWSADRSGSLRRLDTQTQPKLSSESIRLKRRRYLRRSVTLFMLGFLVSSTLWPTEILSHLALFMLLSVPLLQGSRTLSLSVLFFTLLCVPILYSLYGELVALDWADDGSFRDQWTFGSSTLRSFFFDGSYPVFPFFGYILLGQLITGRLLISGLSSNEGELKRQINTRSVWSSLFKRSVYMLLLIFIYSMLLPQLRLLASPDLSTQLEFSWVPVTLPFFFLNAVFAVLILSIIGVLSSHLTEHPVFMRLASLGRLSLTHYVLHLAIAYPVLSHIWPNWDWSASLGGLLFFIYTSFAIGCSSLWLKTYSYGPLEYVIRLISRWKFEKLKRSTSACISK
jgi:uncharacterized protein